jgi:hypothetical protein
VEFTAPASGAGVTFANGTNVTTALTDATGVATASVFSANGTSGGPYTVTALASGVAAAANFSLTNLPASVSITVQTSSSGMSFTVDNFAYTSSQTFQWTPNSSHAISTMAAQAGSAGTRFVFANWSDHGAISQLITAPNSITTYYVQHPVPTDDEREARRSKNHHPWRVVQFGEPRSDLDHIPAGLSIQRILRRPHRRY